MSPRRIRKTQQAGMSTLVLENEKVRAVVAPQLGARILSLIYKPTETDFAWHSPDAALKKPTTELENVSGFFDCIPTTDPCTFKSVKLPEGGEVSSVPWRVLRTEQTRNTTKFTAEARCKIYPLLIRKQISLEKNSSVLTLEHELRNLSDETLEYHYSSHNTLQVTPFDRIVLPPEVSKVKLGYASQYGKMGDEITWPECLDNKGQRVEVGKIRGPCDKTVENLYTGRLKERWSALINEARQEAIGFKFDGDALPYILICTNNMGWRNYYFAAIEPVSGRPDNLDVAVNQWKDYATLKPEMKVNWKQTVILAHNIKRIESIENNEIIQN
jgi:galactose mutarotase-like enzyme